MAASGNRGLLRRLGGDSDGLTLIELMVYSVLLVSVLLIVGTIMISTLSIERVVRESAQTTTDAQLAATSIEVGVRNASDAKLTNIGADQLLVVRTVGNDPNSVAWKCMAWYFSASSGTIRTTSTTNDATAVPVPASEPASWTLLASGISAPGSGVIFTHSLNTVTLYFVANTDGSGPLDIRSSSVLRAGASEVSQSCF